MTTLKQSAWSEQKNSSEPPSVAAEDRSDMANHQVGTYIGDLLSQTIPQPDDDFRRTLAQRLLVAWEDQLHKPETNARQKEGLPGRWVQFWNKLIPQIRPGLATAGLILILSLAALTALFTTPWEAMLYQVMGPAGQDNPLATARTLASATASATASAAASATPTATNTSLQGPLQGANSFETTVLETAVLAVQPTNLAIPIPPAMATPARQTANLVLPPQQ